MKNGTTLVWIPSLDWLRANRAALLKKDKTEHPRTGSENRIHLFNLTEYGVGILRNEVFVSLSSSRERDLRFDLGLAGLPFIKKEEAIEALRQRLDFLSDASKQIEQKYELQGGFQLPLNVRALFLHPMNLIEHEQSFIDQIISELLKEVEYNGRDY